MRDTIDWSYQLLDDAEKTLFRRFSVFAGGCTLEAAQEVCDLDGVSNSDIEKSAASLVDKSLLRQEQHDPGPSPHDAGDGTRICSGALARNRRGENYWHGGTPNTIWHLPNWVRLNSRVPNRGYGWLD